MNWMRDIYEKEETTTIWEKIGMVLMIIAMLAVFWACAAIGSAYEEHQLCMNGVVEHCIEEDFQ